MLAALGHAGGIGPCLRHWAMLAALGHAGGIGLGWWHWAILAVALLVSIGSKDEGSKD